MPLHSGPLLLALSLGCVVTNVWAQHATWNTKWNSEAFLVVRNVPLKRCVEECQARDHCKAVNYWRVRRICELMDNDTADLLELPAGQPCLAIAKRDMTQTNECKDCKRVCGENSERSTCIVKECMPPVVADGFFLGTMTSVGANRKLGCSRWYKPKEQIDRIKCNDGWWGPNVSCIPTVDCGTPPSVKNATASEILGDAIPGTKVVYSCDPGYVASPIIIEQPLVLRCKTDGNWANVGFECLRECPDPDIPNAIVSTGNKYEGSVRTYTCVAEHLIRRRDKNLYHWYYEGSSISDADITCHNGAWDNDFDCFPTCTFTCSCPLVKNVQDYQLTASSQYSSRNRFSANARLNNNSHWAAARNTSRDEYIQVNFQAVKKITHVILQRSTDARFYVKSYKVHTSIDCGIFTTVQDSGGVDKIFAGTDGTRDWVVQQLDTPIQAQCVRINPWTFTWPSLRFGLLGCRP